MKITNRDPEENTADKGEYRVSNIPVQKWHGPFLNTSCKTVSHHQVVPLTKFLQKCHQVGEIIAIIGISHDNIFPQRAVDPC